MPLQGSQYGCEFHLALAGAAPVRIIDLQMRDQAGRQPAVDQGGNLVGLGEAGGAAIDHRSQMRVIDRAYQFGGLSDSIYQGRFPPG